MDRAKAAVSEFLHKDGKHDTTVHERVNPAVVNENVTKTKHEEAQTAIDREVHQDHHHTSVQPVLDREVLPEEHSHRMAGVEHRNIKHGNDDSIKERLAAEQAQFKNTRTVGETQHTASAGAAVAGEHVHHHVHETIQPVVQKETVQPSVVHTTIPIHEVHQNEAKHHAATSLPPVSMDEFRTKGGSLEGREERSDAFAGEPRSVGGTLGGVGAKGSTSMTEHDDGRHGHHTGSHGTAPVAGAGASTIGSGAHHSTSNTSHSSSTATHKKPGLMDKLNPKTDTDGDGKAGIME